MVIHLVLSASTDSAGSCPASKRSQLRAFVEGGGRILEHQFRLASSRLHTRHVVEVGHQDMVVEPAVDQELHFFGDFVEGHPLGVLQQIKKHPAKLPV